MKQKVVFVASLFILVVAAGWSSGPAEETIEPIVETPATPAGYRVHVDPQTRQFVVPEPTAPLAVQVEEDVNLSSEGLVEEPAERGGGVMVNLQGRFRNTSVATINEDGTVTVPCLPAQAESVEKGGDE